MASQEVVGTWHMGKSPVALDVTPEQQRGHP